MRSKLSFRISKISDSTHSPTPMTTTSLDSNPLTACRQMNLASLHVSLPQSGHMQPITNVRTLHSDGASSRTSVSLKYWRNSTRRTSNPVDQNSAHTGPPMSTQMLTHSSTLMKTTYHLSRVSNSASSQTHPKRRKAIAITDGTSVPKSKRGVTP